MRRVAIGLALVALIGLAACTETSPSSEPRTKNAALVTTTTTTPASTTSQTTTTATTITTTPASTTILATTTTTTPASTTPPKAAPTTTVNVPTTTSRASSFRCTISWDGARLTACKQFGELRYQYFGTNGPLSGKLSAFIFNNRSSNISLSAFQGSKSVRISILFVDGSAVSDVDVAIGATVDARFSAFPTPTTAPPTTAPSVQPGCDLSVRYAVITPICGLKIKSYTYRWHDGVKTISGTKGAGSIKGWTKVFLAWPPNGATGALMTFVFSNGQTTRSVLIPVTEPNTITIRALY